MYTSKVFASLALLSISGLASAKCYTGGQEADAATMKAVQEDAQLETVCSVLKGTYAWHEERKTCLEIGGNKYDFTLYYNAPSGWFINPSEYREIGMAECKEGIRREGTCSRGGQRSYDYWQYTTDYNKGKCSQPVRKSIVPKAEEPVRNHARSFSA